MAKKTRLQVKARILDELRSVVNRLIRSPEYERDVNELHSIEDKRDQATDVTAFESLSKQADDKMDYMDFRYNSYLSKETLEFLLSPENEEILMDTFFSNPKHIIKIVPYKWPTKENPELKILDKNGYLTLKINPKEARIKVHYVIDSFLDIYGTREDTRFRKERIKAYHVWEERKLRKPFKQIAVELGITEPTAKKRYYKAYELLYEKKYAPAEFDKPEIKRAYLKRECNTCAEKLTCKDLCPDVIAFVEQDTRPDSERHLELYDISDPKGPPLPAKSRRRIKESKEE